MGYQIGERIKALRKSSSCTQKELANSVGVSASAIGQFERGEAHPTLNTLRRIASFFEIPINSLIESEPEKGVKKSMGYFNEDGLTPETVCPGCAVCGSPYTEVHHIFPGTANRAQSEKYGLTVRLCHEHHEEAHKRPNDGLDLELKEQAQKYFESVYGDRDAFIQAFGRSWL